MKKLRTLVVAFALIVPLTLASGALAATERDVWAGVAVQGSKTLPLIGFEMPISASTDFSVEVDSDFALFEIDYYDLPSWKNVYFSLNGSLGYKRGASPGLGGWQIAVSAVTPLSPEVWVGTSVGFRSVNAATKFTKLVLGAGVWAQLNDSISLFAGLYNASIQQFAGKALDQRLGAEVTLNIELADGVYAFAGVGTGTDSSYDVEKWIGVGSSF